MSVRKPEEAQYADNKHLAYNRKAVDQEGAQPAGYRRFNQIQHVHNTAQFSWEGPLHLRRPRNGANHGAEPSGLRFALLFLYA